MTTKQKCEAMIYRPGPGAWPGHHEHCERPAKREIRVYTPPKWGDERPIEPFTMHVCGVHFRTISRADYSMLQIGTGEKVKCGWRMEEGTRDVKLVKDGPS